MATNETQVLTEKDAKVYNIAMCGDEEVVLKFTPLNGEVLDPALVRMRFALRNKESIRELTVGDGIVDNGDGTFSVTIVPDDFKRNQSARYDFYGLQNLPNVEIMKGNITYDYWIK